DEGGVRRGSVADVAIGEDEGHGQALASHGSDADAMARRGFACRYGISATFTQERSRRSNALYASTTSDNGASWVSTAAGSMRPVRTSSISRGMYWRWLQLPMRSVRFLFIACPIGKKRSVSG